MPYKQRWKTLVNNPLFHHRNNNIQQATLHSGVAFLLYHHPYILPKNLGSYEEKSYLCRLKLTIFYMKQEIEQKELGMGNFQGYPSLLRQTKHRVSFAQQKAMYAANEELLRMNWDIGEMLPKAKRLMVGARRKECRAYKKAVSE